jgi:arylsulfatase A-like enzyme
MSVRPAINAEAPPVYGRGQRAFRGEEIGKPVETETDSQGSDDYLLNYFRCLSAIDDNVGRIMNELETLHIADDTIIVFAGDNGYFLGEHGLGDKRAAYDESMRIPLLWRYPRLPQSPKVIDKIVLNLDLAPTFLDFAGITVPAAMQGLSWKPLLTRSSRNWRNAFLFEYFFEPGLPATPAMMAVRTPTAKLISYPGHPDWTEVFDLKHDPYELNNLARDRRHSKLRAQLEAELARQIGQYGHPFGSSE